MPNNSPSTADDTAAHYFATCALAWAVGSSHADAIKKLARSLDPAWIRSCVKSGGVYVWSCRVELPRSASYGISFYKPDKQDNGEAVPISDTCDWALLTPKGTAIATRRDVSIVNPSA